MSDQTCLNCEHFSSMFCEYDCDPDEPTDMGHCYADEHEEYWFSAIGYDGVTPIDQSDCPSWEHWRGS